MGQVSEIGKNQQIGSFQAADRVSLFANDLAQFPVKPVQILMNQMKPESVVVLIDVLVCRIRMR